MGELVVLRGPNVFVGYWGCRTRRPRRSAAAGSTPATSAGSTTKASSHLVDRKKDMIISGGENVYPIEVEQVLWRHEAVREVAVVGVPHPKWEETPIAVVAPRGRGGRDG